MMLGAHPPSGVRPCLFQLSSANDAHERRTMNVIPAVAWADHRVPSRRTFNALTSCQWRVRRPPPVRRCHPQAPTHILPPGRAHGRVPRVALTGPHHQARERTRVRTSDTSTKRTADLFVACSQPPVCTYAALPPCSLLPGSSPRRGSGGAPRLAAAVATSPAVRTCCSVQRLPSGGRGGRGGHGWTLRDRWIIQEHRRSSRGTPALTCSSSVNAYPYMYNDDGGVHHRAEASQRGVTAHLETRPGRCRMHLGLSGSVPAAAESTFGGVENVSGWGVTAFVPGAA